MADVDNISTEDRALAKGWTQLLARGRQKLVNILLPDQGRAPVRGDTVELPITYRDFQPTWEAKDYRQVDFTYLRNGSIDEILSAVAWVDENLGWYHSIDLPNNIATPGNKGWQDRGRIFSVTDRVKGKTVLDIGAMEGGDSFCAEEAGAIVTALDVDNYLQYDLGRNSAWEYFVNSYYEAKRKGIESEWIFLNSKRFGFELCKEVRKSNVTRISGSVYEIDPAKHGSFDIVYCFGLLYHLRHPLLALDKIYAVTREMTFINCQIYTGFSPAPNMVLFFSETWRGSYTNWFVPTREAFIEMVSNIGYRKVEIVDVSTTSISLICYK